MRPLEPDSPRVSVVLPTYNQALYLPAALDSVFGQTWPDYELIVVNDGSTDETPDILQAYQERYTFTVIYQENQKLPAALNAGFRHARGAYLTWTSSDNIMLPTMLEILVRALDHHPEVGLVYADCEIIDESGRVKGTVETLDFDRHLLMRMNYINACFLYRRACQEAVGLYDPAYRQAEDWEYWWRIASIFPLLHVPQTLYRFRVHEQSLSKSEVLACSEELPEGYLRLEARFRARPWDWCLSKLKWALLRLRTGRDPRLILQPYVEERSGGSR